MTKTKSLLAGVAAGLLTVVLLGAAFFVFAIDKH